MHRDRARDDMFQRTQLSSHLAALQTAFRGVPLRLTV
jgi:hypothetical protein